MMDKSKPKLPVVAPRSNSTHFPLKLMEILDNEEISDIISWLPHERGFTITDKKRFATEVMPIYFKESKYTSFTRRLNRWRFTIQTQGHKKASYYHPNFVRGDVASCQAMRPLPQPARKKKSSSTSPKKRSGSNDMMPPPLPGSPSNRGMGSSGSQNLPHDAASFPNPSDHGMPSSGHNNMPMMPPVMVGNDRAAAAGSMPGFQGNFPMYGMPHFAMHYGGPGFLSPPSHGRSQQQMFNNPQDGNPGGGMGGFYPDNNYSSHMQNTIAQYNANFANNQADLSRLTMGRLGMANQNMRMPGLFPPPMGQQGSSPNNMNMGMNMNHNNMNMGMNNMNMNHNNMNMNHNNMNNEPSRYDMGEGKLGSPQQHHQGDPLREQEQNDIVNSSGEGRNDPGAPQDF